MATALPRAIRPIPQALGLYFRAGRNDHTTLSQLLSQGQRGYYGIVFDASRVERHKELIGEAEQARLETILDPCTQPAATEGGYSEKHGKLPWGAGRRQQLSDFQGASQKELISKLAEFSVTHRFSEVLAPTHFIKSAADPWLAADTGGIGLLRNALDRAGGKRVGIIYGLCLPYSVLREEDQRQVLAEHLEGLPVNSLWLRVSGCGSHSSPGALRNYLEAAKHFAELKCPIVADQLGGMPGLSLLAFAGVGGISTGIGVGERFNAHQWRRPQRGRPFMPHPRVYFPSIDLSLSQTDANTLLELSPRLKGTFGCKDHDCCGRGTIDMIQNPARHFIVQRIKQVVELSRHPETLRPGVFLERHVRPATDLALQLSMAEGLSAPLTKRITKHRRRLDLLRVTLAKLAESADIPVNARLPETRVMRESVFALEEVR